MAAIGMLVNLVLLLVPVSAGEFIVTHAPSHVQFLNSANKLKLSEVQDVISSAFGFDINKDMSWNGLGPGNLFKRPKANVVFSVEGGPQTNLDLPNIATYNTEQDTPFVETEDVVNMIQRVAEQQQPVVVDFSVDSTVFEIRSHQPELFRNVPATYQKLQDLFAAGEMNFDPAQLGSLNASITADLYFLGELHMIKEITKALKQNKEKLEGNVPDFFHFKVRGLQAVSDNHGEGSAQVRDATALLHSFLQQMTAEFRALYKDNVIIEVVTVPKTEEVLSRKARHLLADAPVTEAPKPARNLNLAASYDDMFPVVFNIILWLMVLLILATAGISYSMWFMDPGRDSIIYRMTSQRMKKD